MPSFYKNEDDENHQEYEQDDKGEKSTDQPLGVGDPCQQV